MKRKSKRKQKFPEIKRKSKNKEIAQTIKINFRKIKYNAGY